MARFRCPRCGAIVEGFHERCPRCKVLFKYRREDIDLLTPYKSQGPEVPELIEERKPEEPLPPVREPAPEPAPAPAPVVEEPAPEPAPAPAVIEEKPVAKPDYKKNRKAKASSFTFGLIGFFLNLLCLHLIGFIFGIVALAKAKKAKPIKASGGKAFGIIDILFGIGGILITLFVLFLVFVALVVGVVLVVLNWNAIAVSINEAAGSEILPLMLALLAL